MGHWFSCVRFAFASFIIFVSHCKASRFAALDSLVPQVSFNVQKTNVQALLGRLFNGNSDLINQFDIRIVRNANLDYDWYTVKKTSIVDPRPIIQIKASSGVAASKAILSYLRKYTKSHFSWDGNILNIPQQLPPVEKNILESSLGSWWMLTLELMVVGWVADAQWIALPLCPLFRFRYFGNVCTFSYSMVWWKWADWERFIDWMALNGINLPLSHVGAESVWQRVWLHFGLSQADIDTHFTGPAFLAWFRMGNLYKWGGPLEQTWHKEQELLQKRILKRMTGLGMIPVLQGFDGHVPVAMLKMYPEAKITRESCWGPFKTPEYTCVPYLSPRDPLFNRIASIYMRQLKITYGLYHAYSADPFNEMTPTSFSREYLSDMSTNILKGMTDTDPEAIWVMQGWMFVGGQWNRTTAQYLLTSIPQGQMLVLDLFSETIPIYNLYDSYFGQPFIWNFLHNFGGINIMYGSFDSSNKGLTTALNLPNSTIVGTGLTMEGIYQNYVLYQFMLDRSWSLTELDVDRWLSNYATERYSHITDTTRIAPLIRAWKILQTTVYNSSSSVLRQMHPEFSIHKHAPVPGQMTLKTPELNFDCKATFNETLFTYAQAIFVQAAASLPSKMLQANAPFLNDYLGVISTGINMDNCHLYQNISIAFKNERFKDFRRMAANFVQNLYFLDSSLFHLNATSLNSWLSQASEKGVSPVESTQYESNWRYQLTLWGPDGEILDYARKQWAGLLRQYYAPRWELFFHSLQKSMTSGIKFSQKKFRKTVFDAIEKPFCEI